jgi:hypothetical protein
MKHALAKAGLLALTLACGGCVVAPYDPGPPPPAYGYYGYGPSYPWAVDSTIIVGGHGGYGGGGWRGGGGGWRR